MVRDALSYDDLASGDVVGMRAGDDYAVVVIERRFSFGSALRIIGMNPSVRARVLKSDSQGLYVKGKVLDIPEAFMCNVFRLAKQDEEHWRFVLEKMRFLNDS
jgi:hypothetical protein